MISIRLEKLLKKYDLNISELSESTGIARSTLTPLVKQPNEVQGLRIDTVNTLCEFFGVSIDELLNFTPEKKKYKIFSIWSINTDLLIGMQKQLGSKHRQTLLSATYRFGVSGDGEEVNIIIAPLSKKEIGQREIKELDTTALMDGSVFTDDLLKKSSEIIIETSRIIAMAVLKTNSFSNSIPDRFDPKIINVDWKVSIKNILSYETLSFKKRDNDELTFIKQDSAPFFAIEDENIN